MNRRSAVKSIGICLGLAPVSTVLRVQAQEAPNTPSRNSQNGAVYSFKIGSWQACSILAGGLESVPRQPFFAPEVSEREFDAAIRVRHLNRGIRMPFNVLLLRHDDGYVLIDTGAVAFDDRACELKSALDAIGVSVNDISIVIVTHAHFDHIGGLLTMAGEATFSRATHYCLGEEIDFWTSSAPDLSRLRMNPQGMLDQARRTFERIRFVRARSGIPILEGITPHLAPGHTPGHMALRIDSGRDTIFHIADLSHHALLLLQNPRWSIGSDVDGELAADTRIRICSELAQSGERVFGFHMPFPGIGRLRRRDDGFDWLPEDYSTG